MNKLYKILFVLILIIISAIVYIKYFVYKTDYIDYIKQNITNEYIDPYIILSIIKTESKFKTNALSRKEAKGLMQLLDSTFDDVLKDDALDVFDPETNIKAGIMYFEKLVNIYNGNQYLAIIAYNAGMGNVNKWLNDGIIQKNLKTHKVEEIPFKETRNYLNKVVSNYKMYKFLYND